MLHKEKNLDIAILQMHMDDTHLQKDIKTVQTNAASAQVDFQKSPSSNLIHGAKLLKETLMIC